ncbi:hypothetical protein AAHA92_22024 [Salvia divinorum]|uniref:Uncharacterized protein n=1 Tax=Salvia divinorum TaxID=28513 RepID=A0ABD1GME1_SALDI
MNLQLSAHPCPYWLQWLGENGSTKVTTQAQVPLKIGKLDEEVLCDVIPMTAYHVLLGRPWEYDNKDFEDTFPSEFPNKLPPIWGIEHQLDFISGSSLPNWPHTKPIQMRQRNCKGKSRNSLPKAEEQKKDSAPGGAFV